MIRRIVFGGLAVGAVLATAGCVPSAATNEADLARIKEAVLSSTPAVIDGGVSNGLDGFTKYILVAVQMDSDTIEPDDLAAVLVAVGETVPNKFARVEFAADQ